jgi:hypothetical protein
VLAFGAFAAGAIFLTRYRQALRLLNRITPVQISFLSIAPGG